MSWYLTDKLRLRCLRSSISKILGHNGEKIPPKYQELSSQRAKNHNIVFCEQNIQFKYLKRYIDWIWHGISLLNFVWTVTDYSFLKFWVTMVKNYPKMAVWALRRLNIIITDFVKKIFNLNPSNFILTEYEMVVSC